MLKLSWKHKGTHPKIGKVTSWGLKYEHTDIRDQIRESEFIDFFRVYDSRLIQDFSEMNLKSPRGPTAGSSQE